jgi:hypothetical protein
MTITELLASFVNHNIDREDALRALFAHRGWLVPLRAGLKRAIETNVANTDSAWIMSGDESYRAACTRFSAEAIGEVARFEHVDEILVDLTDDARALLIEPAGPITQHCMGDDLLTIRLVAQAVFIERAMRQKQYPVIRRGRYLIPYYGTPGHGHEIISIPTIHGRMIPVFTSEGAVARFLETGTPENRARVRFMPVDGDGLFGGADPTKADGLIVNIAGPESFGFDIATCRAIGAAE